MGTNFLRKCDEGKIGMTASSLYVSPVSSSELRSRWMDWQRTEFRTPLWWQNPKVNDVLDDRGVNKKIILKLILNSVRWLDLIQPAHNTAQWRALVNMVIQPRVP
jgi:hypothetical protein